MSAKETQKKNAWWNFFSSVKLTIFLLIVLAAASIIGTLVPQREGALEFAQELRPETVEFLARIGIFDMYHALWFRILIGCLALNLVVCSLDRFPSVWKRFRNVPALDRERPFEDLPAEQTFLVRGRLEEASAAIEKFLKGRYRSFRKEETTERHVLVGEKGRYAYFGVYLIHLSVLVILIGALLGSFLGLEAFVRIPEGESVDRVFLRGRVETFPLGFQVRCDDFSVEFYESGAPKEYRSELTFLSDGKEVERASLLVNHPVKFRGVTFYQSSYEKIPGKKVRLRITKRATPPETLEIPAEIGKPISLPGNEGVFQVTQVNAMGPLPVALVHIEPKQGEPMDFYVFQDPETAKKSLPPEMLRSPKFNSAAFEPYLFALGPMETRYATGLQVNRDPGVTVVWIGCALMIAGFFVTFFLSHRRIWVRLSREKGGLRLMVAGQSHKNPVGLERELRQVVQNLTTLLGRKEG
jgi:cytochrome c biogenesis protein